MKMMALVSCYVALCTASSWDHPLQRAARTLGRQAKIAQAPCSMFTQAQKDKCSYGKTMRDLMSGAVMACAVDMSKPGCADKVDAVTCMSIVSSKCLPEPTNVQCSGNDVGGFVEMMSRPCDKLTDPNAKSACTVNMMKDIGDDCLSCIAVNSARASRGETQLNCWGSFAANQQCTWESTAKVMGGFTCSDETVCNQYKASMTENDHVCLGCMLSIHMGPKDSTGQPTLSPMDCMSAAAKQQRPCKQNQLDPLRDWTLCTGPASDAKDECERAISESDPDKDTKEEQCEATEKAAQATCKQNWVSQDASYNGADKITEGCTACFMVNMGNPMMCVPPDQRCAAPDVPKVQAGYDCAVTDSKCREDASNMISGPCRLCQMQNKVEIDKSCTLPPVKDANGEDEADYFKCIPKDKLCDLEIGTDGKVAYKATPRAPTPPPMSPGNPPTAPPKRKYRKLRALLKLAKKKVKQSMREFCADQTERQRCKKIAKELANKIFKALKQKLGELACTSVLVTHLCKLVGAATEITDAQRADPAICALVEEMSDAGRMASFLQNVVTDEGTLTAVYEMAAAEDVTAPTLTGVVDRAQADGSLSVSDPVGGEELVTGGEGTTGSTTDLGPTVPPPPKDDDGSDVGLILGIVFGILAALGLVAVAAVVVSRKKASQFQAPSSGSATAPMYHQTTQLGNKI